MILFSESTLPPYSTSMRKSSLLRSGAHIASFLSAVRAFNVTVGTPTQCDDLAVSWTGGQAPFEIVVTPFYQALQNFSVPASTFSNGEGSYSIPQFPYKNGTNFLLTMSDATGFGSGGTSITQKVGAPVANNNCNTTIISPDFYYTTPLDLQQCNEFEFTYYSGAHLPATITGLIPGGEHFTLGPVTNSSYTWAAVDIEAGTSVIFFMIDSSGRQGGVSPIDVVKPLSDTSCINVNSPSSTASTPSQTSSQSTPSGSNTTTIGIIAGATVGGVVLLVSLIILGIFCIRKASRSSDVTSRQSRRVDDGYEVKHLPPMQPESKSRLDSMSAGDTFTQHLRQSACTDSFAGSSSISSPNTVTFSRQTLPVGLAPPIHPGSHSYTTNASAGKFAVNDPYAPFSQIQRGSQMSSNLDTFAGYGDAGRSSIYSSSRQMAAMTVSHPALHNQPAALSHPGNAAAGSFMISDPPSPLPIQPSHLSSNIDGIAGQGNTGSSSGGRMSAVNPCARVVVHTDIEDVRPVPGAQDVIELPPQYIDRQLLTSQLASEPNQRSSLP